MGKGGILYDNTEEESMNQQIQELNQTDEDERSVRKQHSSILLVILLVIIGLALFVGACMLSIFVLTECFKGIPPVPAWMPILIIAFDVAWFVLIKFCLIRHRIRAISNLVVLSVSAGVLFGMLCVWGIPA
jgi:hypothetical protein